MNTDALHLQITDDFLAGIVRDAITIVRALDNVTPSMTGKSTDDKSQILQLIAPSGLQAKIPLNLSEELPVLW